MRVGRWLSDCGRLRSAICGEYARKLLWDRRFRWSACCRPCTVNPSRKLRRFESFTCHHVRERASDVMKERGLLPLPAAPPSGMLGSIQSAVREGEEAPNGSVCRKAVCGNRCAL